MHIGVSLPTCSVVRSPVGQVRKKKTIIQKEVKPNNHKSSKDMLLTFLNHLKLKDRKNKLKTVSLGGLACNLLSIGP